MTLNHNNFTSIVNKATLGKLSHNFNYKWFPPLCSVSVPCTNVHDILTWVARQMWLEDQEVSYIPIWSGSPKSSPGFECWLIISLCIMFHRLLFVFCPFLCPFFDLPPSYYRFGIFKHFLVWWSFFQIIGRVQMLRFGFI